VLDSQRIALVLDSQRIALVLDCTAHCTGAGFSSLRTESTALCEHNIHLHSLRKPSDLTTPLPYCITPRLAYAFTTPLPYCPTPRLAYSFATSLCHTAATVCICRDRCEQPNNISSGCWVNCMLESVNGNVTKVSASTTHSMLSSIVHVIR
jgi:hypothetical protein